MNPFHLSFRNRIALYYLIGTALMVMLVFGIIYGTVSYTIYKHVDGDLTSEVNDYIGEIEIHQGCLQLVNAEEWQRKEHNTLSVSPVFIQVLDEGGVTVEKSPNLKKSDLVFNKGKENFELFDTKLDDKSIRQIQFSMLNNGKIAGYILIAISLEESNTVLNNLGEILCILYPIILLVLFFAARFIAGKSIKPIRNITETSSIITRENLTSRIALPINRDELYVLSETINNLLDRVENAISREKEFTADASHELRTPLAVIKGTLEVLIRKPRNQAEYEEKINFCINEVDRLNHMVDQLLLLARFENQGQSLKIENVYLNSLILENISRFSGMISAKKIKISSNFIEDFYVNTDGYLLSIILNNLISNAIKYSNDKASLTISIIKSDDKIQCILSDTGIGIPAEDLQKIFDQFYRSKSTEHSEVKGTGLGLSIVKRLCTLLDIHIDISSSENVGTNVILNFPVKN